MVTQKPETVRESDDISLDELPEGWSLTSVGELFQIVGGGTPSTKVHEYWEGDIPWITSADIYGVKKIVPRRTVNQNAIKNSAANLVPKGSIIVVTRVSLGRIAICDTPISFSQDCHALIPKTDSVDPEFALYYLSQAVQSFKNQSRGTTISGVTVKVVSSLPFLLPPLAEQQHIVSRVEALLTHVSAARDRLSRVPLIMKRFRQTVLQFAIEGRLLQLDSSEKISITDDIDNPFPSGWKLDAIENQVSRLTNGYVGPTRDIYINKGIPYLLARHIKKHKIVFDQRTFISEEFNQKNRKSILKKGDVLVVQSGDIGQTAVVEDDHVGHNCHALIVITPKKESLDGRYLSIYFSSITGQEMTRQIQTGITLKHLNCKDVKKIKIPLPPLAEQHEIVRRVGMLFERADAIDREVVAASRRAEALTQAILGKAFRGELVRKMESSNEIK